MPSSRGPLRREPPVAVRRELATEVGFGLYIEVEDKNSTPRKRSAVSFHTFRHTCASMLFEAGCNVNQVSEWLGHADLGFTLRTYVHLMDAGVGDADFMDRAVDPRNVTKADFDRIA